MGPFYGTEGVYCNIRYLEYNILYCQNEPIQHIVCNILQYIYVDSNTSYTTRYAYLHASGSITLRTMNCNTRHHKYITLQYLFFQRYNILQYELPTIQYIAMFVEYNPIYSIVRTHQYIVGKIQLVLCIYSGVSKSQNRYPLQHRNSKNAVSSGGFM
jgi:hypothetical protein